MNTTNNIPQETVNSILIEILRGAKDASSEIYSASKVGIVKAVDFAQEQSPLVVQEFLAWRFSQAIIYLVMGVIALALLGALVKKCLSGSWRDATEEASGVVGTIFGVGVSLIILGKCVIPNMETIVQIKVAPRVYVIEWVAEQVQKNKR